MKRHEVILKALQGELTWIQVAEVLGVTPRQVRRIRKRYERFGPKTLLDSRRGPARNKISEAIAERVRGLFRDEYFDFNVKHFHERLQAEHGIKQSYCWTLTTLQTAGLVEKHRRRDVHRKKRERRPLPGMMIHLDGSEHCWLSWLGEEFPKWDLLATLDDATNEVYDAFFTQEEDTRSVLQILRNTVDKSGIFCSLYTDRATHFIVTLKAGEKPDKNIRTQCQRALDHLGIRLIAANSPQARGRGERLWRTFQGRLPQELRRAGVKNMEQANQYLREVFLPEYNRLFKVISKEEGTAFTAVLPGMNLDRVFSIQHERIVTNDNTVSYKTKCLQLPPSTLRFSFARCKVMVHEHLNGEISIGYGPHTLGVFDSQGNLKESEATPKGLEQPLQKAA